MSTHNKIKKLIKILHQDGLRALIIKLIAKFNLPIHLSHRFKWKAGIGFEVRFWDNFFRTKGDRWPDGYKILFMTDNPLGGRIVELLPEQTVIQILDVGAGPISSIGKTIEGKNVIITAIDPLADEYDRILKKYKLHPPIKTQKLAAEELSNRFSPNTFDLAYARNCLDHAYDPEKAILEMIQVIKNGCFVLLEHGVNEAVAANYSGFHQWNFSVNNNGEFLIGNRSKFDLINMTKKCMEICTMRSEIIDENGHPLLVTRIQKRIS